MCCHDDITYTLSDDGTSHKGLCRHCNYVVEEKHAYTNGVCTCGKMEGTSHTQAGSISIYCSTADADGSYDNGIELHAINGKQYSVPDCSNPKGYVFMGWLMNPATAPATFELQDGETLVQPGTVINVSVEGIDLYARYVHEPTAEWKWEGFDHATATIKMATLDDVTLKDDAVSITSEVTDDEETGDRHIEYTATAEYKYKGYTYTFTDMRFHNIVSMNDAESNMLKIMKYDGAYADAQLYGRTLYMNGQWEAICLPFDIADIGSVEDFQGATVKELVASSFSKGTLTLNFKNVTSMEAGRPYLVKWADNEGQISNPVFAGITLKSDYKPIETDNCIFWGFFSPYDLTANDRTMLYMGDDSQLYYPDPDMTVNAFRGVFQLTGDLTAGDTDSENTVRKFILNLDDDTYGTATGVALHSGADTQQAQWYTIDGRRLNGKPSAKGIYVHGREKVALK